METPSNDNQVIDLLEKIKKIEAVYPTEILTARRQNYLEQVANIGLGARLSAGIKNTVKGGNGTVASVTVTGKILETVLAAALILETGTVAYLYRDKIADIVKTYMAPTQAQEATPPPDPKSPQSSEFQGSESVEITETQLVTITVVAPSNTPGVIPSGTPAPEIAGPALATGPCLNRPTSARPVLPG